MGYLPARFFLRLYLLTYDIIIKILLLYYQFQLSQRRLKSCVFIII